jgi:hypothetical protein
VGWLELKKVKKNGWGWPMKRCQTHNRGGGIREIKKTFARERERETIRRC